MNKSNILIFILVFSLNLEANDKWTMAIDKSGFGNLPIINKIISQSVQSYKDAGINISIIDMPLARSLSEVKNGRIDSEAGRGLDTIKANDLNYINVKLMEMRLCLYNMNERKIPYSEAVVVSMRGIKAIDSLKFKKHITLTTNEQALNFFKMRRKHIDYFIGIEIIIDAYTKKLKLPKMKCVDVIYDTPIYHVISKKHADKIPKLEKYFKRNFKD